MQACDGFRQQTPTDEEIEDGAKGPKLINLAINRDSVYVRKPSFNIPTVN